MRGGDTIGRGGVRDNNLTHAIDFDKLRELLDGHVREGEEAYEFTWVGKKAALVEANTPIRKTLRPVKEESKDWDTTENLYIEGDNLDALKLLQESYLGKVKMIYIDPPYNTGNDFIYNDDFKQSFDEYEEESGHVDEDGNRMKVNHETDARFHSKWCSMIYSRLRLARNLLADDGVIFISIDDHEVENLKKILSEVLGESNFIAVINWKGRGGRQDSKYYAAVHEYILCYAKNKDKFIAGEEKKEGDVYPKFDVQRKKNYKLQLLRKWGSNSRREDRPNLYYPITAPDGTEVYPIVLKKDNQRPSSFQKIDGCWRHGANTMKKNMEEGNIEFVKQEDGSWIPYEKIWEPEKGEEKTKKYTTWIEDTNNGAKEVKELFDVPVFDYPKSIILLDRFLRMANVGEGDIILDFFSGSATTAHAVMQLNAEDGGHRKFIMVQLPEATDEKSEAYKAGYKNICEIGKERIRRAGAKILAEHPEAKDLDTGFRVLRVDSSNMKDVYYRADEVTQASLLDAVDNVKEDRSALDLLFGCLVDWGLPLSLPYAEETIAGVPVLNYSDGDLIACFAAAVPEAVVRAIAERQPLRAVFRDSSFADSPARINVEEIFRLLSPDTDLRVL